MNTDQLEHTLAKFSSLTMLVIGDYFLDLYLEIDSALAEISIETGLEAHQVIRTRRAPGAAGTVTSNLRALGVHVIALGVIGDDGNGYELKRALRETGVDIAAFIESRERLTPTYTKPMRAARELNRLDIKNRSVLSSEIEDALIARLRDLAPRVDGIIVVDQVQEEDCGVVTHRVRDALATLAAPRILTAESRARIGLFRNMITQTNFSEARAATELDDIQACGIELAQHAHRPAIITAGANGIFVFEENQVAHIPGVTITAPIDVVGAGDSVLAGFSAALCAGASARDAAYLGNLVASITVQQIGVTGTATPDQVRAAHAALER